MRQRSALLQLQMALSLVLALTLVLALVRNMIFSKVRVLVLNQPIKDVSAVTDLSRICHRSFIEFEMHLLSVSGACQHYFRHLLMALSLVLALNLVMQLT